MAFKSSSKYKHTVGTIYKKELWYPDLKPNATGGDFNSIAASGKWIAVSWFTGGQVGILNITEVGKRKSTDVPIVFAHSSAVTDMSFSPFSDDILATSGDDCTVKLWKIPENSQIVALSGHKKRVDCIQFHPSARNVIASGSSDKSVKIWDIEAQKEGISIDGKHDDGVTGISWNWNGNLLATVSKDKKIRVIDVRANQVVQQGEGHQGIKPSKVVWLGEQNRLATTGFSKLRERQFAMWDATNLSKYISMTQIDNSTGVFDMFFDNDTGLLYLAGKGDGSIKVYETDNEKAPFYKDLTTVQSDISQRSTAWVPKRACDMMAVEIGKILKLSTNAVVPVGFNVPRKAREFQEDLFPPTQSTEPALESSQWFSGETNSPKLIQLKPTIDANRFWYLNTDSSSNSPSTPSTPAVSSPAPSKAEVSTPAPQSSTPTSSKTSTPAQTPQTTPSSTPSSGFRSRASSVNYGKGDATETKTVQVVRSSKYRHIVGKGTKPEACYSNLKAYPAGNNSVLRVNPSYFIYPIQGAGGRVGVIPLSKPGKQPDKQQAVIECGSDCLDFDLSTFDDSIVSTVTESAVVQLWKIPPEGLKATTRQPETVMKGHTRRVTSVDFHPVASNILVTSSGDNTVRLWDITKAAEQIKFEGHNDTVMSISWNYDGSIFASSSKDKGLRIVDPRANKTVQQVEAHDGVKGFKVNWMGKQESLVTVGFTKGSQRQAALWDLKNLSTPVSRKEIDNGAGVMTPYFDPDTNVLFLSGKGDGNIKMYEVIDNDIFYLTEMGSSIPTLGFAQLPKWKCNVKDCEIAYFFKLTPGDYVEPLHFTVPRTKLEYFQDDIFPPTKNTKEPTLSGEEWFSGTTKEPSTISLKPEGMINLSDAGTEKKEKKYDFATERAKEDSMFTKEKFLKGYYDQMNTMKEGDGQVLKQELMEGVDSSEWDD